MQNGGAIVAVGQAKSALPGAVETQTKAIGVILPPPDIRVSESRLGHNWRRLPLLPPAPAAALPAAVHPPAVACDAGCLTGSVMIRGRVDRCVAWAAALVLGLPPLGRPGRCATCRIHMLLRLASSSHGVACVGATVHAGNCGQNCTVCWTQRQVPAASCRLPGCPHPLPCCAALQQPAWLGTLCSCCCALAGRSASARPAATPARPRLQAWSLRNASLPTRSTTRSSTSSRMATLTTHTTDRRWAARAPVRQPPASSQLSINNRK